MERRRTLSIIIGAIVLVLAAYAIAPPVVKSYAAKMAISFRAK